MRHWFLGFRRLVWLLRSRYHRPEPRFAPVMVALEERALLSGVAAPGSVVNPVIVWNAVALDAIRQDKTAPPVASYDLAILQASVYDAVNSMAHTGPAYRVRVVAPPGASLDGAVIGAAHEALVKLFPKQAAVFNADYLAAVDGLGLTPSTLNGVSLGQAVADGELGLRANDGSSATVSYTPGTALGLWQPTPPAYAKPVLPGWGQVTPFVLKSGSQFRPAPPPTITSAAYAAALNQVETLGASNSTVRTPDQTQIALFWDDGAGTETPPGHWNQIAEQVGISRGDSIIKSARVFALLDLAEADAGIACWDVKYTDNFWRPVTAIRKADLDGNPATTADPSWSPLITTPAFPSYVSGHSTFSAAAATVLTAMYGPNVHFSTTSDTLPGVTRSFTSFKAAAQEAGMSRIYGGIHYSFDNLAGQALGRQVGQYVLGHALSRSS